MSTDIRASTGFCSRAAGTRAFALTRTGSLIVRSAYRIENRRCNRWPARRPSAKPPPYCRTERAIRPAPVLCCCDLRAIDADCFRAHPVVWSASSRKRFSDGARCSFCARFRTYLRRRSHKWLFSLCRLDGHRPRLSKRLQRLPQCECACEYGLT